MTIVGLVCMFFVFSIEPLVIKGVGRSRTLSYNSLQGNRIQ